MSTIWECGECGGSGVFDSKRPNHTCIPIHQQTAKEIIGRTFESGAYRDQDESKLDFVKALSPEVLERYVSYLSTTRLQSNGEMRDWDNWKAGIPKDVYLSSLYRHVHTIWKNFNKDVDLEEELCAVMFNAMGLLFEILKEKDK